MPEEGKDGGAPKVVKKVKKVKRDAPPPEQKPAGLPAPALEKIGASPPQSDFTRAPPPAPAGGIREFAAMPAPRPAPTVAVEAPRAPPHSFPPPPPLPRPPMAPEAPRLPPPPPRPEEMARIFVPPGTAPREPPKFAPGKGGDMKSVEARIGSIDIDKLTSELEKDILNTLTSEIGDMLTTPAGQPKERKEVREDHAAPTGAPPARPAPGRPPEPLPQDRAMENEQRERRVAYRLGREFDKLPVNMRNELIKTLARTDDVKVREDVVIACASNFDKLPLEIRALLRTLANDRDSRVREEVAFELNRNFNKITAEYRNELIPLLARDVDLKVREDIVAAIASHYDRHPPEVQEILRNLASDRKGGVRDQVAHEVLRNTDRIPEPVRTELNRLLETAAAESRDRE